jgi:hypothetical protein
VTDDVVNEADARAPAQAPRSASRVEVASSWGLKVTIFVFLAPLCAWFAYTSFESGRQTDAFGVLLAGCAWFAFLRLFSQRLEYRSDGISFRGAIFEYTFPGRAVERVALLRAGRSARLDLADGSPFRAEILDWNWSPRAKSRRAAIAASIRAIPRRPYEVSEMPVPDAGRWRYPTATEHEIEALRPTHAVAPLSVIETAWIALTVIATAALAIFGS